VLTLSAVSPCWSAGGATIFQTRVRVQHVHSRDKHAGNENVVVWLVPEDATTVSREKPAPQHHYEIAQKDKQFHPHVIAVPVGTAVEFPNLDPWFHNVFSLYNGKRFDLGLYEAGSSRSVKFERPGVSFIFCNIHPEMNAYLLALETSYFAVTRSDGRVVIRNVPPGNYRLKVWYESATSEELNQLSRDISLPENNGAVAQLRIHESAELVPTHSDKHGQSYDVDHPAY